MIRLADRQEMKSAKVHQEKEEPTLIQRAATVYTSAKITHCLERQSDQNGLLEQSELLSS